MTLYELIQQVELTALTQPTVNMIVQQDVFKLNQMPDCKYAAFAWLQKPHNGGVDQDFMTYSFTFFYVDRLTADESNMLEIQSTGIQTLDNILKTLASNGVIVGDYTFTTFNERFADACAGVFVDVSLQVPAETLCNEDFPLINII